MSPCGGEQRFPCCSTPVSVAGPLCPLPAAVDASEPLGEQSAVRALPAVPVLAVGLIPMPELDGMPALAVGVAAAEVMPAPIVGVAAPLAVLPPPPFSATVAPAAMPATRANTA